MVSNSESREVFFLFRHPSTSPYIPIDTKAEYEVAERKRTFDSIRRFGRCPRSFHKNEFLLRSSTEIAVDETEYLASQDAFFPSALFVHNLNPPSFDRLFALTTMNQGQGHAPLWFPSMQDTIDCLEESPRTVPRSIAVPGASFHRVIETSGEVNTILATSLSTMSFGSQGPGHRRDRGSHSYGSLCASVTTSEASMASSTVQSTSRHPRQGRHQRSLHSALGTQDFDGILQEIYKS